MSFSNRNNIINFEVGTHGNMIYLLFTRMKVVAHNKITIFAIRPIE